jgi:membrane protease YdiL (CAAX protease family)
MHAFAVTELCVVLFAWGAVRLVNGRDWKRKVALRRPGGAHLVLALVGLPALCLLGNGFYLIARQFLPGMESFLKFLPGWGTGDVHILEEVMNGIGQWHITLAVLIIGLGPGIGEELWCRAFLGRGLVGRYGVVVGIALTSFFFGLIHLDPAQGTMAMLMGVCLHFVYQTTRTLWIPVLLHFLNNSASVVAQRFPSLDALDKQPMQFLPLYGGPCSWPRRSHTRFTRAGRAWH